MHLELAGKKFKSVLREKLVPGESLGVALLVIVNSCNISPMFVLAVHFYRIQSGTPWAEISDSVSRHNSKCELLVLIFKFVSGLRLGHYLKNHLVLLAT